MKFSELFPYTFKALRHELGHDRPRDSRPMWQQRLSADSGFCRAVVANGYLTETQVQRALSPVTLAITAATMWCASRQMNASVVLSSWHQSRYSKFWSAKAVQLIVDYLGEP